MDWSIVPLRDVLNLDLHRFHIDPAAVYEMAGVYSFGRGLFRRGPVLGSNTSYKYFYKLNADHVVMSQLFGWEGSLALSSDEYEGLYVSPQFPTFSCDSDHLDRRFLGWFIKRPIFWEELGRKTKGMGDRRRTLNPNSLLSMFIPLPPISEQRRIVSRIEELAGKIEEVLRNKADIEQEAGAMLYGAFTQIIDGAPLLKMDDVAPLVRRPVEPKMGEEYPELGIRSFGKGTFHKPILDYLSVGTKKLYRIEPGDLLFSNVFAWEGAIAVAQPHDNGRFGSHRFITCVPKEGIATPEFLCFYFLTEEGLRKVGEASPGGAGRNRTLGLSKLAEIEVPVPEFGKQIWFNSIQDKVDKMLAAQRDAATELDALLPSILDRAFRGNL